MPSDLTPRDDLTGHPGEGAHVAVIDPPDASTTTSAPEPDADPTMPLAPSREDPVVASASQVVGGPLGRHAILGRLGIGGAFLALAAALVTLVGAGVVERAHCVQNGWSTPDHFWHACYSDIPVVYSSSGLAAGTSPFSAESTLGSALPTSLVQWALAVVVPAHEPGAQARWYFGLWSALVVALLVVLLGALLRGQRRHPWRIAHLASPALPFVALASFEVVPVTLAGVGLVAWGRRRPVLAGALLGLACLARPWTLLVVAAIGLLALRAGRLRPWLVLVATAAAAAVLGLGAASLLGDADPLAPYRSWWSTGAGYGSPWYLASIGGYQWPKTMLTLLTCAGWLFALGFGAVLALSAPRRPRVGEVALVVVMVAAVLGKSLPVQAGLWVVMLLAVVGVRWRVHLVWAAAEVSYYVAVWLHIAATSDANRGLPGGWYGVFVAARVAAWVYVVVVVWRHAMARPAAPVVAAPPVEPDGAVRADGTPGSGEGGLVAEGGAHLVSRAELRSGARLLSSSRPVAVVEDDELAGPLAGAPDETVVTFV